MKFTVDVGRERLDFLDVQVSRDVNNIFSFSVYRKPCFTGLLLNFSSFTPISWKSGIITCLLKRAYRVCSTWAIFDREVTYLRKLFVSNGYPVQFFNKTLKKFLEKMRNPLARGNNNHTNILVLPYMGQVSDRFSARFRRFCNKYNLDYRLVFKPFKIGFYFSLKSSCPAFLRSCLVYKFVCSCDTSTTYIGKTKRHLYKRVGEHLTYNSNYSAIFEHIANNSCNVSRENFSILRSCNFISDLNITEALLIKKLDPKLNKSIANSGQSTFLKLP